MPSLYGEASWLKRLFFGWCFPIIKLANNKRLKYEDLGGLRNEDLIQNKLEMVEKEYEAQSAESKDIATAMFNCFKWDYMKAIGIWVLKYICDMFQPFIFSKTVEYLKDGDSEDTQTGLWLAMAMFLSVLGCSLFHEHGCFQGF